MVRSASRYARFSAAARWPSVASARVASPAYAHQSRRRREDAESPARAHASAFAGENGRRLGGFGVGGPNAETSSAGNDKLAPSGVVALGFHAKSKTRLAFAGNPRSAGWFFFVERVFWVDGSSSPRRRLLLLTRFVRRCFRLVSKTRAAASPFPAKKTKSVARRRADDAGPPVAVRARDGDVGFRGASSTRRRASGLERRETLSPASSRRRRASRATSAATAAARRERVVASRSSRRVAFFDASRRARARATAAAAAAGYVTASISSSSVSLGRDPESPAGRVAASSLCVRKNADPWNRSSASAGGDSALRVPASPARFSDSRNARAVSIAGDGNGGALGVRLDVSYPRVTFSFRSPSSESAAANEESDDASSASVAAKVEGCP